MQQTDENGSETDEIIETPGLAEAILMERIKSAAEARLKILREGLRPSLKMYFIEEARRTNENKVPKSFRTEDSGKAAATVQVKVNQTKALSEDDVVRLRKAGIRSLKATGTKTRVLNPKYFKDATFAAAIARLAKNEKSGLPADATIEEDDYIYTSGDATFMEVLRLAPKTAVELFDAVAEISISKPTMNPEKVAEVLKRNPGRTEKGDLLDSVVAALAELEAAPVANPPPVSAETSVTTPPARVAQRTISASNRRRAT